jgi:hypothetical protein
MATPVALAGLSILESVMIALVDKGIVTHEELQSAMQAAIDSHMHAEPGAISARDHRSAAAVIRRFMAGANSVRASARL